jgi:hypothetical protein
MATTPQHPLMVLGQLDRTRSAFRRHETPGKGAGARGIHIRSVLLRPTLGNGSISAGAASHGGNHPTWMHPSWVVSCFGICRCMFALATRLRMGNLDASNFGQNHLSFPAYPYYHDRARANSAQECLKPTTHSLRDRWTTMGTASVCIAGLRMY